MGKYNIYRKVKYRRLGRWAFKAYMTADHVFQHSVNEATMIWSGVYMSGLSRQIERYVDHNNWEVTQHVR